MATGNSPGAGFLAVFAVSVSVALISGLFHKRLLSDFMNKIELELGSGKLCQVKKRVRFADEVEEWRKESDLMMMRRRRKPATRAAFMEDDVDSMPLNRQILYKQILEYKALRRP